VAKAFDTEILANQLALVEQAAFKNSISGIKVDRFCKHAF